VFGYGCGLMKVSGTGWVNGFAVVLVPSLVHGAVV